VTASVTDIGARRRWMSILAKAESDELEAVWTQLGLAPEYRILRGPEVGLVMVRARAGGTGTRFNLGEMTVTRCTVQLAGGAVGHAYVRGRRRRHAELAAALDAILQDPLRHATFEERVVARLAAAQTERRRTAQARAAATRVEFLTLVRGED
jgi:alpha-D-ribose 1-methylphosphonate 5-triphosphate synthase subunit PhnG